MPFCGALHESTPVVSPSYLSVSQHSTSHLLLCPRANVLLHIDKIIESGFRCRAGGISPYPDVCDNSLPAQLA